MARSTTNTFVFLIKHNPRLLFTVTTLATTFFTFGYDGSVMGGLLAMQPFARDFGSSPPFHGLYRLSARDQSLVISVPTTGCLLGLPLCAWLGDRIGRRRVLLLGAVINLVGSAIQTAAPNMAVMVFGRWLANASIFLFIVMASNLMAEVSPPAIRGIITGLSILLIDCAALLSQGINYSYSTSLAKSAYRIPLSIEVAFALLLTCGLYFINDSPTFYLTKGHDEIAFAALCKIRKDATDLELEAEFAQLKAQEALREEESHIPLLAMFRGIELRRTLLSLSIANMQQFSGIAFATNYVVVFLGTIGGKVSPFILAISVAVLALAGAIVGLLLVDWVGRRVLALTTFTILFIINLTVGVLGFADPTNPAVPKAIAAFCCMFAFFYAAGFGPLTYIVAAEMPTARLRNRTNAFTFLTVACFSTVVTYVLPYIADKDEGDLGPKTYLIFAGWMLGCIIITFFCLPETKGRSPAELDEMFAAKVPARNFATYVCAETTRVVELAEKAVQCKTIETVNVEEMRV